MFQTLLEALQETLLMVFSAGFMAIVYGFPLGALLSLSGENRLFDRPILHKILHLLIHTTAGIPFVAFMIALIPLTKMLNNTPHNNIAAILPLTLAAIPLFAQLTSEAIDQVPRGLIEVGKITGASRLQTLSKIILPEALPHLVHAVHHTLVRLIAYSMIAGLLGAGGLGKFVLDHGYYGFRPKSVLAAVIVVLGLTKIIQSLFDFLIYNKAKT